MNVRSLDPRSLLGDLADLAIGASATVLVPTLLLAGCASAPAEPLPRPESVDLDAFMGDWYVLGGILTPFEDGAHNAVESYRLDGEDEVAVTFRFNRGAFDGKEVTYHPRGFVRDGTGNVVWGMQFVWPLRMDYRILAHDETDGVTVIGRKARDFVWIMARTPSIPEARYAALVDLVVDAGYERAAIRRVPQQAPR